MKNLGADELKRLEDISTPDPRFEHFIVYDGEKDRKFTLNDFHAAIREIELNSCIPENIRIQFETVRNLYLYSWYVYRFGVVAELQAYATLEYALREKAKQSLNLKDRKIGFKNLLDIAIKHNWVIDEHIQHHKRNEERREHYFVTIEELFDQPYTPENRDAQEYCRILAKTFPELRNNLAHGSPMLWPPFNSLIEIEICADLINQLFED